MHGDSLALVIVLVDEFIVLALHGLVKTLICAMIGHLSVSATFNVACHV